MSSGFEIAVLGAMLLDEGVVDDCLSQLLPMDFQNNANREIFISIQKLRKDGKPADLISVSANCNQESVLMDITARVATSAGVENYIKALQEQSRRRALGRVLSEQLEKIKGDTVTDVLQDETETRIMAVRDWRGGGREAKHIRDVLVERVSAWAEVVDGRKKAGIRFGLHAVDSVMDGALPGKYTVIGARPGVGKSALALQLARQSGVPCLVHSLEMLNEEQGERIVSQVAHGVDSHTFRSAEGLRQSQDMIRLACAELKDKPIYLADDSTVTVAALASECRTLKRRHGVEIVVIDYLQLVNVERRNSRTVEVGDVSKSLKRMANDLKIHVIALASLSRECEKRDDKRPIKADLRESGDIEHDADAILMLYRESDYNKKARDGEYKNVTEFLWRKNRGGAIGDRVAIFDGKRMNFSDPVNGVDGNYRNFLKGNEDAHFMPR